MGTLVNMVTVEPPMIRPLSTMAFIRGVIGRPMSCSQPPGNRTGSFMYCQKKVGTLWPGAAVRSAVKGMNVLPSGLVATEPFWKPAGTGTRRLAPPTAG